MSVDRRNDLKKLNSREKNIKRHKSLFAILKFFLGSLIKCKLNLKLEKINITDKPVIILANHNNDWDPIILALAANKHTYFVASEHIYRWPTAGKLIKYAFDPIIRMKGRTEARAAAEIIRTVRNGQNVCVFAEGNRSFNGETGRILPSTAKLISKSGVNLVTYALTGGYFTYPRWARSMRRGVINGKVMGVYDSDELSKMTHEEIYEIIKRDLYVNEYDANENGVNYKGGHLAENIEISLFTCENCNKISTISSKDDKFYCDCGLKMRYTKTGTIEGIDGYKNRFNTILDWDKWQFKRIKKLIENGKNDVFFGDGNQKLFRIIKEKESELIGKGSFSAKRDCFIFETDKEKLEFPFDLIEDVDVIGKMVLTIGTKDRESYEILSDFPRSAHKYRELFRMVKAEA